jgi:hypothetical protein
MASVAAIPLSRSTLNWRARPAKPRFSTPIRRSSGTCTSRNSSVPLLALYQRMPGTARRSMPGPSASMSSSEMPPAPAPPVRTAARMQSARMARRDQGLRAVDEPMIVASFGARLQRTGVGSTRWFRDCKCNAPLPREHGAGDRLQQFRRAELHDGRQADPMGCEVRKHHTGTGPVQFFGEKITR